MASALLGPNNEVQRLADLPAESPEAGQGQGQGPLRWLPQTLAAVSLRLYSLDANLVYTEGGQPDREVLLVKPRLLQVTLIRVNELSKQVLLAFPSHQVSTVDFSCKEHHRSQCTP